MPGFILNDIIKLIKFALKLAIYNFLCVNIV